MDPAKKKKLVALFRAEVNDHLGNLSEHLLVLEKKPATESPKSEVEEIFRSFHTLKGCARALGAKGIEVVCHRLEEIFSKVRSGKRPVDPPLTDVSLKGLDVIRELQSGEIEIMEDDPRVLGFLSHLSGVMAAGPSSPAPEGEGSRSAVAPAAQVPPVAPEAQLPPVSPAAQVPVEPIAPLAAPPAPSPATPGPVVHHVDVAALAEAPDRPAVGSTNALSGLAEPAPAEPAVPSPPRGAGPPPGPPPAAPREPAPPSVPKAQETIRVAAGKLDSLMNRVGELVISKIKTDQRLQDIQGILTAAGRCTRAFAALRNLAAGASVVASREWRSLDESLINMEQRVTALQRDFSADIARMSLVSRELEEDVRYLRLLPFSESVGTFHRMVRDMARELGKDVVLRVEGGDTEVDKGILEGLKDPILHLLRNALDHGIEWPADRTATGKPPEATIVLKASQQGMRFVVEVTDDGRGIDLERVRNKVAQTGLVGRDRLASLTEAELIEVLFRPGFSTAEEVTEISGRGVGLDVVAERLARLNGTVEVQTRGGCGTTVCLSLPLTLITTQALLVRCEGQMLALPTASVERTLELGHEEIKTVDCRQVVMLNGQPILLVSLGRVLELPPRTRGDRQALSILILFDGVRRVAFHADEIVGEQEVVHKSLGKQYIRVRNIAGATILGTGRVVIILNPQDLIRNALGAQQTTLGPSASATGPRRVLVVEDSYGTRTYEREILEQAGFEVHTAVDGAAALEFLAGRTVDLIVSDVEMPRLDGISMTRRLREQTKFKRLPIVLVTHLESPRSRQEGLEAGADVYVQKQEFDQEAFIDLLKNLSSRV
ncbi:MAG: hybrid sensor histidine kinase/response regulator [Candidatus Riflebacteria bacterium]|nr:hybrid sensor histidine kinase/response regulator [Candidatus Riflebacteria bacterium]